MEDEQGPVPSPLSTAVLVTSPVLQEKLSPCQRLITRHPEDQIQREQFSLFKS